MSKIKTIEQINKEREEAGYTKLCRCQNEDNCICCSCNNKLPSWNVGVTNISPIAWHQICNGCFEKQGGENNFWEGYCEKIGE